MQNKGNELRAGKFIYTLYRDPQRHCISSPKVIGGLLAVAYKIFYKLLRLGVSLFTDFYFIKLAGSIRIFCEYLGVYIFGNESRKDRQMNVSAGVTVKMIGFRVKRE